VFDDRANYAFHSKRTGGFGGWYKPASGAYKLVAYDRKLGEYRWQESLPVRVRAMTAAGPTLLVAGTPDVVDAADPWAAVEGRRGGVLQARSVADGSMLAEYRLDAPPVYDGMAVAGGRVYVSTKDGNLVCFAGAGE
jgi:outer membrane protein assembly factor BamB